jgi:hypothetical protein
MEWPTGSGHFYSWDMTICHTWYAVGYGEGNVAYQFGPNSSIWDGDNPPPRPLPPSEACPPFAFMCP